MGDGAAFDGAFGAAESASDFGVRGGADQFIFGGGHFRKRKAGWAMPSARRFCQTVPKVRPVSSAASASGRVPSRASSSSVHGLGLRIMERPSCVLRVLVKKRS